MLVRRQPSGWAKAQRSGISSSPNARNPNPTSTFEAAPTRSAATTMSTSMTGFAASPGTAVLPTCSIPTTGTPAAASAAAYRPRNSRKSAAHAGS